MTDWRWIQFIGDRARDVCHASLVFGFLLRFSVLVLGQVFRSI
jgi:hypothetical protein